MTCQIPGHSPLTLGLEVSRKALPLATLQVQSSFACGKVPRMEPKTPWSWVRMKWFILAFPKHLGFLGGWSKQLRELDTCVSTHACVCAYMCTRVAACVHPFAHVCACMCVCLCTPVYMCAHSCTRTTHMHWGPARVSWHCP